MIYLVSDSNLMKVRGEKQYGHKQVTYSECSRLHKGGKLIKLCDQNSTGTGNNQDIILLTMHRKEV